MNKQKSQISSDDLAGLIVDSLIDKQLVREEDYDKAIVAVSEEIQVRKALSDYWCRDCLNNENG